MNICSQMALCKKKFEVADKRFKPSLLLTKIDIRRVARNLQWGLFRTLETTSNDLDPEFGRSLVDLD